jgi:hypothetical protein
MPKRRHICDVPHCGRERQSWQRLCSRCFDGLSHARRSMIKLSFRHDKKRWRQEKKLAGQELGLAPATSSAAAIARHVREAVSPDRALELHQRILGERPDA